MRKKYVAAGILLAIIVALATPISYVVAYGAVSDAVFRLGFASHSGSITVDPSGPGQSFTFAGEFIWANSADFPLTIDLVNITVYVYEGPAEFSGSLHFLGPPGIPDAIHIGSVVGENVVVPARGKGGISRTFSADSLYALSIILSGDYNLGASYRELTVSGTYLFWHFTPPIRFQ